METTHLGKASSLPASPEEAKLDYVPNPRAGAPGFEAIEYFSLILFAYSAWPRRSLETASIGSASTRQLFLG